MSVANAPRSPSSVRATNAVSLSLTVDRPLGRPACDSGGSGLGFGARSEALRPGNGRPPTSGSDDSRRSTCTCGTPTHYLRAYIPRQGSANLGPGEVVHGPGSAIRAGDAESIGRRGATLEP